jgi:hypothetical protein
MWKNVINIPLAMIGTFTLGLGAVVALLSSRIARRGRTLEYSGGALFLGGIALLGLATPWI